MLPISKFEDEALNVIGLYYPFKLEIRVNVNFLFRQRIFLFESNFKTGQFLHLIDHS